MEDFYCAVHDGYCEGCRECLRLWLDRKPPMVGDAPGRLLAAPHLHASEVKQVVGGFVAVRASGGPKCEDAK